MDSRIEELKNKYWEANTSLEEEIELKNLLNEADSEADLEELKALFAHFDQASEVTLGDDFDQQILSEIESEPETKVVSFNDYFRKYASMAAAVILMLISAVFFYQDKDQATAEDTFETPEEAYAELKRQLMVVSMYMNKGNNTVRELSTFGEATDELAAIGKMSSAETGLEMLEEMNVNN